MADSVADDPPGEGGGDTLVSDNGRDATGWGGVIPGGGDYTVQHVRMLQINARLQTVQPCKAAYHVYIMSAYVHACLDVWRAFVHGGNIYRDQIPLCGGRGLGINRGTKWVP
jgi:hypothetical protein